MALLSTPQRDSARLIITKLYAPSTDDGVFIRLVNNLFLVIAGSMAEVMASRRSDKASAVLSAWEDRLKTEPDSEAIMRAVAAVASRSITTNSSASRLRFRKKYATATYEQLNDNWSSMKSSAA
jgi:hypothetical protein